MAETGVLGEARFSFEASLLRESLRQAFTTGARCLRGAGMASPELDARLLLLAAAGLTAEAYIKAPERLLPPEAAACYGEFLKRRMGGEPVSRILGRREFYGRDFTLSAATLDPRPDSECLIEAALAMAGGRCEEELAVLDLGTGSGCLLITLLAELPKAAGLGIDRDLGALIAARANAERLGVASRARFICGDWLDGIGGGFDLVVANPPYIPSSLIGSLAREVREHDPRLALDGGADGLDAYRAITARLGEVLKPGGTVLFEVGEGQSAAVLELLDEAGLTLSPEAALWHDLSGTPRCVAGQRPCDGQAQLAIRPKKRLEVHKVQARLELNG